MASSSLLMRVSRSLLGGPRPAVFSPSRFWCAGTASSSAFTRALIGICAHVWGLRH